MLRFRLALSLSAFVALAGCSAEPDAAPSAQLQTSAAPLAPVPHDVTPAPDRIAHRPAVQPFAAPAQLDDLPLWPPTSPSQPLPPSSPAPPAPSEQPPQLPTSPFPSEVPFAPLPETQPLPMDVTLPHSQPPFSPALPASELPSAPGFVPADANPLRASQADLATLTPAVSSHIPPLPLDLRSNPLRQDSGRNSDPSAPPFPVPAGSSVESLRSGLLPHAPMENAPPAPPVAPARPESQPAVAAPQSMIPRIAKSDKPARLPRVPINPQAHAEWSAKREQLSASLDPSGGSAPPSEAPQPQASQPAVAQPATTAPSDVPPAFAPASEPTAAAPAAPQSTSAMLAPPVASLQPSFSFPTADPGPGAAASPMPEAGESAALVPEATEPASAAPEVTMSESSETPSAAPPSAEPPSAEPLSSPAPAIKSATTALLPAPGGNEAFDVVRVFYGTDRSPELVNRDTLLARLIRFSPAAILILLSIVGAGVVLVSRKITWTLGTIALVFFSTLSVWHGVAETVEIAELAEQEERHYTAERSERGRMERGICEVAIPKTHDPGEMETPSVIRFERQFDPARHITLRKTVRLHDEAFYEQLRTQVASSPDRELLVFVHGFNVSFEDAARRTAQMAHDLKLQGAPVFFSWPADKYFLLTYGKDEASVSWAAPHLKDFLLDLVHSTDARAINLVAHSMGNRALTTALREIDLQLRDESKIFNQVVLAAPDIDADDFRDNIVPAIQRTANQVTLYASSHDIALSASRIFHRNPRAGDTSRGLVLVPGMHTIDVSNIDGGPWGHSYYGASDPVLRDLHLLLTSLPPERRTWLKMDQLDGQTYWAFKPLGTPGSPAMMTPR